MHLLFIYPLISIPSKRAHDLSAGTSDQHIEMLLPSLLDFLYLQGRRPVILDCARRTRAFPGRAFREQEDGPPLPRLTLLKPLCYSLAHMTHYGVHTMSA